MNYENAKKQWSGDTSSKSSYYEARMRGYSHEASIVTAVNDGDVQDD